MDVLILILILCFFYFLRNSLFLQGDLNRNTLSPWSRIKEVCTCFGIYPFLEFLIFFLFFFLFYDCFLFFVFLFFINANHIDYFSKLLIILVFFLFSRSLLKKQQPIATIPKKGIKLDKYLSSKTSFKGLTGRLIYILVL